MPSRHVREHHLHHIWVRQHLETTDLCTTSGKPVRVIDAGSVSLDAGPDIRGCRLRIGGTLFAGDIEIHRTAPEWNAHGHHVDPHYNGVILHVLLKEPPEGFRTLSENGREVPMLTLHERLKDTIGELQKDAGFDERDQRSGRLHCTGLNHGVPASLLRAWLETLAAERFEIKLRRCEERVRELARAGIRAVKEPMHDWGPPGESEDIPPPDPELSMLDLSRRGIWDQVLYEGIMEGLGYSKNRRPFLALSRALTLTTLSDLASDAVQTEALLFGVSGLLPAPEEVGDVESRMYVHILRSEWSRLRERYRSALLSRSDWVSTPSRPLNAPIVRLVAARSLISKLLGENLFGACLQTLKQRASTQSVREALQRLLRVDPGPFWERRVSFVRIVPNPVQPLGTARTDDLIINAVLPLALLYARLFRSPTIRTVVLRTIASYPPTQSNTITQRIERHLLRGKVDLDSAVRQQGAVQLFNYYCSGGRCRECEVGKLVWG